VRANDRRARSGPAASSNATSAASMPSALVPEIRPRNRWAGMPGIVGARRARPDAAAGSALLAAGFGGIGDALVLRRADVGVDDVLELADARQRRPGLGAELRQLL